MKTPIDLQLDGKSVAQIISFSYETPWATGEANFDDKELFLKLVRVSSMSSFYLEMDELELDDEEEERLWEARLSELDLTWEDLKLGHNGRWSIVPNGGECQPIYSPKFYEDRHMDWRL